MHLVFTFFLPLHGFYIPSILDFTLHRYTHIQEKHTENTLYVKSKVRNHSMTIFNVFSLLGGLALFLFGMDIMGKALEKQAGGQLQRS